MADKVPVYTPYSIHPIKLAYLECLYRVNVGEKEDSAGARGSCRHVVGVALACDVTHVLMAN